MSNHSFARSARTLGANGRKSSRCLIRRLRMSRVSGRRGSASSDRLPSARGQPPCGLKPSDDAVGDHVGGVAGSGLRSPRREAGRADGGQNRPLIELRTEIGRRAARSRTCLALGTMHASAAPIAVPHRAARRMKTSEKVPDVLISSLVTQLSATPPATHRRSTPVARARRLQEGMTAHRWRPAAQPPYPCGAEESPTLARVPGRTRPRASPSLALAFRASPRPPHNRRRRHG